MYYMIYYTMYYMIYYSILFDSQHKLNMILEQKLVYHLKELLSTWGVALSLLRLRALREVAVDLIVSTPVSSLDFYQQQI